MEALDNHQNMDRIAIENSRSREVELIDFDIFDQVRGLEILSVNSFD